MGEPKKVEQLYDEREKFRDSISTIDKEGKRVWIYPKKPKGKLYNYRSWLSYFFLAFLLGAPFIKVNGEPLLLFNVLERKFIIFGLTFWPQDFFIFVLAFVTGVVFIILFTVIYGRIFCGWVCPQTIFMEMFFRKIEYFIEGDYTKQKALDKAPWTTEKIVKKTAKHLIFFGFSFFIANVFLAYIISADELWKIVTDPPVEHIAGLTAITIFSGVFYFIFAKFREQVCTIACPYGRLQGVLLDKKSIIVAYDYKRGEPRGKLRKNQERTIGDCIDCHQCVHVCPTGIDIRNGTQMECINCTACIDACNNIMDLVDKPRGLIRYDSEDGIQKGEQLKFTTRIKAYTVVLVLLVGLLSSFLFMRNDVDATMVKTPGMLYQKTEKGAIRNVYDLTVINKTAKEFPIRMELVSHEGTLTVTGGEMMVPKQGMLNRRVFVDIPTSELEEMSTKIKVAVYSGDEKIAEEKTKFLSPPN